MVQHSCSCKKGPGTLAYCLPHSGRFCTPARRLSSAPTANHHTTSCTARVFADRMRRDSAARNHCNERILRSFAVNRKGNSPPGCPLNGRATLVHASHPHHAESSFGGCVQSASAGPAAAVPLVRGERGWVRLREGRWTPKGKGQSVARFAAQDLGIRKQGDLVRGRRRSLEALRRYFSANHTACLRGRPGGWLETPISSATLPSTIGEDWRVAA